MPWLYPPEILPLSIRAKGASLSTAANWFFNYLVGELTPILQETIHYKVYLIHAFFCALSFVVVYFIFPETKGLALEEMDTLFGDESVAPTPRGPESQSLFDPEEGGTYGAEPPDEEQLAAYVISAGKKTDLGSLFDKLRGVQEDKSHDQLEDGLSVRSRRESNVA